MCKLILADVYIHRLAGLGNRIMNFKSCNVLSRMHLIDKHVFKFARLATFSTVFQFSSQSYHLCMVTSDHRVGCIQCVAICVSVLHNQLDHSKL